MSEKTKIKVDIRGFNTQITSVELEPNSTIFDLTREVARKLITENENPPSFRLIHNNILINTIENKDKTINSFNIGSNPRVFFIGALKSDNLLSWDTIELESEVTNETKVESENKCKIKLKNKNNWPLLRIIIGIIDLLLLLATITTFLLLFLTSLNLFIAVPIVLTVLFFVGAALFFGFGKILPKSWTETPEFTAGNNIDKQNNSITRDERQNMPDIEENNSEKTENDL